MTSIDDEFAAMMRDSERAYKAPNRATTAGLIALESRKKKKKKKTGEKTGGSAESAALVYNILGTTTNVNAKPDSDKKKKKKKKKKQQREKTAKIARPGDGASIGALNAWIQQSARANRAQQHEWDTAAVVASAAPDAPVASNNEDTVVAAVDRSAWTLDDLLAALQRDLNMLSDKSSAKRRLRALRHIERVCFREGAAIDYTPRAGDDDDEEEGEEQQQRQQQQQQQEAFDDKSVPPPAAALRAFYPHAMKPLLRRFADPSEACRETAVRTLAKFIAAGGAESTSRAVPDLAPTLPYAFPAVLERTSRTWAYDDETKTFVEDAAEHEEMRRGKAKKSVQQTGCVVTRTVVEPSEEVRLLLGRLVRNMVARVLDSGSPTQLAPYFSDTVFLALTASVDPFPDAKLAGMRLISLLCARVPVGLKMFAVGLVKQMVPALTHRLSRVRIGAMHCVSALVMCEDKAKCRGAGSAAIVDLIGHRDANVIPTAAFYYGEARVNSFAKLVIDSNANVRFEFVEAMGTWMHDLPDRCDHHGRLVPYMLSMLSDESPKVQARALHWMEKLGRQYEEERQQKDKVLERRQYGVDGDRYAEYEGFARPAPFQGRPRVGARMFVRAHARRFIKPLLEELSDWRSETRVHAALLLRTLIVYLEEHITVHLHKLVGTLCRCANGLSAEWSRECTALVCKFVPVDSFVALVLPIINMDVDGAKGLRLGGCGGNTRARALVVLGEIIRGVKRKRLAPHAADIAACLGGDIDAAETRDALERQEYLNCARAFGEKFQGKAEFVNDKTGRLVSLRVGVGKLLECVERARVLGVKDAEVGTVGAAAAAALAEQAKEALLSVLMDPALRRQMEAEKEGRLAALRRMQSEEQGGGKKSNLNLDDANINGEEVSVGKRTVDLDSDGEGDEFEVE